MPKPSGQVEELIKQWLFRFGIEHKEDVAPKVPLWLEAFGGMEPSVLSALFAKTMRTCKFFPKIAEILEPLNGAQDNAEIEKSERAWNYILEYRRRYWNPDMPSGFSSSAPELSDRLKQAARASGIFRDFDSVEALHVWAKKSFIESYLRYAEMEQDQFLLPAGELKEAFRDLAKLKSI